MLVFASDLHIGEAPGELYEIVWWMNVNFWLDMRQASKCRAQTQNWCRISLPGTVDLSPRPVTSPNVMRIRPYL